MAGELEQNATSVERILHQTNIKSEAPAEIPDMDPHGEWPSAGAIEVRNYR
jgi:ATP-binding cassette, subfamily C (CFTR/MRP), member 1